MQEMVAWLEPKRRALNWGNGDNSHPVSAADVELLSSYPSGLIRCGEEDDDVRDILGVTDSAQGDRGYNLTFEFRSDPSGLDRAK